ncbi:MAG: hypothetical protein KAW12_12680 [Candidatus Aminicenantes bacterium]|nr:hypothetical protein [Candidatus Aminicenantes bacterium]
MDDLKSKFDDLDYDMLGLGHVVYAITQTYGDSSCDGGCTTKCYQCRDGCQNGPKK